MQLENMLMQEKIWQTKGYFILKLKLKIQKNQETNQ